ncbi:unnamed protein product [Bursaphelenchus okinawaensis]|uniref:WD_REPEATS_REGION domain-containing protein n=1 Tax=Bursaphelenchus okinawaensis TaxID=465554 RepID=A0A811LDC5_9BILA|nr:unnamed protein product [Bursaphelenchus okinawaensis]CAG9121085.1 unnamed protein product [Bursaphelenchus okinawaensis]
MAELAAKRAEQLELQLFGSVAKSDSESEPESDRSGSSDDEEEERPKKRAKKEKTKKELPKEEKKDTECVWNDEDDEDIALSTAFIRENAPGLLTGKDLTQKEKLEKYSSEIRDQFIERAKLGQKPEWLLKAEEEATKEDEDSDDDEALQGLFGLQKTASKYVTKSATLPRTYLQCTKLLDPTTASRRDGKKLKSVLFHPTEPVLVTANTCGNVQLYRVARSVKDLQKPADNPFLQEFKVKGLNVDSIGFYDDGTALFLSSNRNEFFYQYNLMDGHVDQHLYPKNLQREWKTGLRSRLSSDGEAVAFLGQNGELYVFHRATMEHLHTFMASSRLADATFSPVDRNTIIGVTETGQGYIWNLKAKGEQKVFTDQGAVRCKTMKISENGQFLAIGQNTGIVNVYEMKTVKAEEEPKPLYTLTNLTTAVTFLNFNLDSQMLAFGSDEKPMHYRIAHLQSGTVFKNFPPKNEMLSKDVITSASFSPHSGFVAFGTMSGGVRLYRLNYFDIY